MALIAKAARNDPTRADRVIAFIQCLTVPTGSGQGKPLVLRPWQIKFIRDIYTPHDVNDKRIVRRAILSMGRKNGKALALDTKLPTPKGWVTIGDVKEGDTLFDENGNTCKVTFATRVQNNRLCFNVCFADGSSIIADADHQWTVNARRHRRRLRGPKVTLTTLEMAGDVVRQNSKPGFIERNYSVDVAGPIKCCSAKLPIPPYTLGVWLGDGSSYGAQFFGAPEDELFIAEEIAAEGVHVRRIQDSVSTNGGRAGVWSLSDGVKDRAKVDCTKKSLRSLDLLQNKHIPSIYQRASIPQRRALLQGLMDTDGYVSKTGQCEFSSIREQLAKDFLQLVRGLGIKATFRETRATLNGIDCGPNYKVQFWSWSDRPAFRLPRKVARLKSQPPGSRNDKNSIVAIYPVDSVPVKCIQVDSPSSLFLAGEGFTPTHNTVLIAALLLVHLIGPESTENAEIYSAANDHNQAALVFRVAAQFVRADPELSQLLRVVDSTKHIACFSNGSFYKALSAEAGTKHGLNPTLVIYDELAQSKSRELYDVLDTSMGAQSEPLFITISTQSNDPEHILSKLIDDGLNAGDPRIVCHLYAVPDDCKNIYDPAIWKLGNPALGDFLSLDDMQAEADKAQRLPAEEPRFRNLRLNQRVSSSASLISRVEWLACVGDATFVPKERVYLALDLSAIIDLSALIMISADNEITKVQPFIWKPKGLLTSHSDRDFGSGNNRYAQWVDDGYMLVTPGKSIDPSVIALKIAELCSEYDVLGMAYDRWRMADLIRELDRIQLPVYEDKDGTNKNGAGLRLIPWGQGFRDMAPAIDSLESKVIERKLIHPGNPVLTWAMANAVATMDPAGNRKLDKEKARFRIDPAVALTMACGLKSRDREEVTMNMDDFLSSPIMS